MKWYSFALVLGIATATLLTVTACDTEQVAGDYFYAITNAGTLCGYSAIDTSLATIDGKQVILIEQHARSLSRLLGMDVDSEVELVYHVDLETGQFLFQRYDVDSGQNQMNAEVRIEADGAHCTTSFGREDQVVPLPPGTLLENSLFFKHIVAEFTDPDSEDRTYQCFEIGDQEIQDVQYSRAGDATIELVGTEYTTLMVDRRNLATGVLMRFWLDTETGLLVKILENEGRVIYLADKSLADDLERFEADDYILTDAGLTIADVSGISYMKVRAKIKPTGLIVTPETLNVPGQRFTGTVEDNLIEGVFEIEHPRYDGADAPAFPPDFSGVADVADFLDPTEFIESDDPAIGEQAHELTVGSPNSWEAARRLSEWVSTEIAYAIPGGGSARGVYEARAGECGGHSVLLAAFCRSVGIPARMVWGVTYVPSQGGKFGQHGWTEIYMGNAGWIPVDATGPEIDFVDSGHIRLGLFESFSTWANAKEFEILDYRVIGSGANSTDRYENYLGEYYLAGMPEPCEILVQDGSLVLDIPGNTALAFADPDERGRWQCKLAAHIYLTFELDDSGNFTEAHLHEVHELPRQSGPDDLGDGVPAEFQPYLGTYRLRAVNAEFTISYSRGSLRMHHPLEDSTSSLSLPNDEGGWVSDNGRHMIFFERGEDGEVDCLVIDATSKFIR